MPENNREKFLELRKKIIEKEFSRMNPCQREAVFQTEGPLLVLAGAGSGKTTVLVNRIACILKYGGAYHSDRINFSPDDDDIRYLEECLESGNFAEERLHTMLAVGSVPPWSLMAITFTNKAANEMKERLSAMLGDQAKEVWAFTFHSTCSRILRRDIDKLDMGYTRSFTIYDTDDSQKLIRDHCRDIVGDDKSFLNKVALPAISKAKERCMGPKEFELSVGTDFRLKKVAQIYYKYQKALHDANALDFDDILRLTVRLLETNSDVLEYYQRRFKYILVDEYQDTNPVQYRFVSMLAGLHHNLCVVGDDDQSIYSFRGATIENIMNFEKQFSGAKVIKLEQNYRSTGTILDAANAVIANNEGRKGKNLWTQNDQGDKITVSKFANESEESQYLSSVILEDVKNGMKFSDHAILYRMNAQSSSVEKAFVRCGIPYRIIGGFKFYDRLEIKDMLAYLKVINNRNDSQNLRRIINSPKRNIGTATVEAASQIAEQTNRSLYDVFLHCDEYQYFSRKAARIGTFMVFLEDMRVQKDTVPLHELLQLVMEKSGYLDDLKRQDTSESKDRIENLSTMIARINDYENESETPTLEGFLEEAALMTDLDNYDEEADTVVMMTIHSAKGLEFPTVFIAGMEEGVFPGQSASLYPQELEEERRLAYVGITRAKKRLFLTYARERMLFGSTVFNRPSRFIEEIPAEFKNEPEVRQQHSVKRTAFVEKHAHEKEKLGVSLPKAKSGLTFIPGETVSHSTFGKGMILSVKPMGGDTLLEIAFDRYGTKKLMANFAKLQKA